MVAKQSFDIFVLVSGKWVPHKTVEGVTRKQLMVELADQQGYVPGTVKVRKTT